VVGGWVRPRHLNLRCYKITMETLVSRWSTTRPGASSRSSLLEIPQRNWNSSGKTPSDKNLYYPFEIIQYKKFSNQLKVSSFIV
jgi:hypothetical protein